jgi:hypothetical protein
MRDDMCKVIVERPRRGSRIRTRDGRIYRAGEDVPSKIGMKRGYTNHKSLNENLSPLKRWLQSQADRPWDKVYAELCANIDRRNTVQEHIFTHIDQFVERETVLIEGRVNVMSRWRAKVQPIEESWATLYVHPVTGLLRWNRHRITRTKSKQNRQKAAQESLAAKRRDIDRFEQLHCIEGAWYHVTLAMMGEPTLQSRANGTKAEWIYPKHWDVMRKKWVSRYPRQGQDTAASDALFGMRGVYAAAKRQLSHSELRRHALRNENAGDSRRFRLWRGKPSPFTLQPSLLYQLHLLQYRAAQ